MSAFLVSNESISKIAKYLQATKDFEGLEVKEIAKKLYKMNCEALRQRYVDYGRMVSPFEFKNVIPDGLAQTYNSIGCFLYQCSEGNVTDSELYKEVDEVYNSTAHKIASDWADKQGVRWE